MINKTIIMIGAVLFASMCGCAGSHMKKPFPEPRPLGSERASFQAPRSVTEIDTRTTDIEMPLDTLTLSDALSLALTMNPELAAISWEQRAKEAHALQEGLFHNPELDIEVENINGQGLDSPLDVAETTLLLSQLIETGGKRSKRSRFADLGADLTGWDYETKRLEILTETTVAFVDVLAAQERVLLSEETYQLSDRIFKVASERVKGGKVSPLEESKASVSRALSTIQREKERKNLDAAMKRLASFWGTTSPSFEAVAGDLDIPESLPMAGIIDSLVVQNPHIARWTTEIEQHRMELALAKAQRIPDLTVSGGIRWFEETGDQMFVFGLSIPLPLFDRNQGNVRETEYMLARAREEQRAAYTHVRIDISEALRALSSAHSEALVLKRVVLPTAEQAFMAAREGYRQGKFGFLEVLDAQKTFAEVRYQYIEALVAFHRSIAKVETLIGQRLDTIMVPETKR